MPSFKSLYLWSAAAILPLTAQALDETTFPFTAPTSSDSRSPCPGLNALANHGILPRDGKNIDLDILVDALYTGYTMAGAATLIVGSKALKASTTGNASTFHLSDLNQHDPQVIEHDGSMSRNDEVSGDDHTFNAEAWARTLASWGDNETITYEVAAAERTARFAYGAANNPEFNATFGATTTLLEYALLFTAFGTTEGFGNTSLVVYLIENDRLPLELGWQPPVDNTTAAMVQSIAAKIGAEL